MMAVKSRTVGRIGGASTFRTSLSICNEGLTRQNDKIV